MGFGVLLYCLALANAECFAAPTAACDPTPFGCISDQWDYDNNCTGPFGAPVDSGRAHAPKQCLADAPLSSASFPAAVFFDAAAVNRQLAMTRNTTWREFPAALGGSYWDITLHFVTSLQGADRNLVSLSWVFAFLSSLWCVYSLGDFDRFRRLKRKRTRKRKELKCRRGQRQYRQLLKLKQTNKRKCFACRKCGRRRLFSPRVGYRKRAWFKRIAAQTWTHLSHSKVASQVLEIPAGFGPPVFEKGTQHVPKDFQVAFPAGLPFHAGAGGSATTARKRKEDQLLKGLQQLLSSIEDSPEEPDRSRSPSPGWQVKGKGKERGRSPTKRKGKGKGGSAPALSPEKPLRGRSSSPKHVTFQEGNGLLGQLKALVLEAEVNGEGNLFQRLKHLVMSFSPPIPGPKRRPKPDPKVVRDKPKHEATEATAKETPKGMVPRIKLDHTWWNESLTSLKRLYEALDVAEEPGGTLSTASFRDVVQIRALAETHNLTKPFALITFDEPSKEEVDQHKGQLKWCRLAKGQWKKLLVFPLRSDMPQWPEEPTVVDVSNGQPKDTTLDTYRVIFPKRFLTSSQWETATKKPATLLATALT